MMEAQGNMRRRGVLVGDRALDPTYTVEGPMMPACREHAIPWFVEAAKTVGRLASGHSLRTIAEVGMHALSRRGSYDPAGIQPGASQSA